MMTLRTAVVRFLCVSAVVYARSLPVTPASAQDPDGFISLREVQEIPGAIDPTVLSQEMAFVVDNTATWVNIHVFASADNLLTSIEGPGAQMLDPATIGNFGGMYAHYGALEPVGYYALNPLLAPGINYFYSFPSLGAGTYTLTVAGDAGLSETVAFVATCELDSELSTGLTTSTSVPVVGSDVTVMVVVVEGTTPVSSATVDITVIKPDDTAVTLFLADDGAAPDYEQGDGLYSGTFVPGAIGSYILHSATTGQTSGGAAFARTNLLEIEAVSTPTTTVGTLSDWGQDDNGNGLYEWLVIGAEFDIPVTGTYAMRTLLSTASGAHRSAYHETEVTSTGVQVLTARFDAKTILNTCENGPYTIERVELFLLDEAEGLELVIRAPTLSYSTYGYLLSQFEREPIRLTGVTYDEGIDSDHDGDFDILRVTVGIDIRDAGDYYYTVGLFDQCNWRIQLLPAAPFPPYYHSSPGVGNMVLDLDGTKIGQNGVDGPFYVRNLLLYGPSGSLVSVGVAETQVYLASQFDGFTSMPDCNNNGTPDACDVLAGTSPDCSLDQIPDECEPDCNGNGISDYCEPEFCAPDNPACQDCNYNGTLDGCDISSETSPDCNWNGVPDECDIRPSGFGYLSAMEIPTTNAVELLAVGDLNRDNYPDVVIAHACHLKLSIFINNGDRSFATPQILEQILDIGDVRLGKLDQDADLDIVTAGDERLNILLNDGHGAFGPPATTIGLLPYIGKVDLADLDGDGDLDMALLHRWSEGSLQGAVEVLVNDGTAQFTQADLLTGSEPLDALVSGDFDGDLDVDLAVTTQASTVWILLNNGDATFSNGQTIWLGPLAGWLPSLATGDFDGDNDLDLAITDCDRGELLIGGNRGWNTVGVWLGFELEVGVVPVGDGPHAVAAGDLDGDPHVDLMVADCNSKDVRILRNRRGIGEFSEGAVFLIDNVPMGIAPADLDGDRLTDLAVGTWGANDALGTLTVFWNASFPPVAPDYCNANGMPDECEGLTVAAPQPEPSVVPKNRYLTFVPGDAGRQTALRVTLEGLPPPFEDYQGCKLWVALPKAVSEVAGKNDDTPPTFVAAGLQSEPYCMDWGTIPLLYVYGSEIVPRATYSIQAIDCVCDVDLEVNYSAALSVSTGKWGDVVGVNNQQPPNDLADFNDIGSVVDKFKNLPGAPQKARTDVAPRVADGIVDFGDIPCIVDAFRGLAYPYSGPENCP